MNCVCKLLFLLLLVAASSGCTWIFGSVKRIQFSSEDENGPLLSSTQLGVIADPATGYYRLGNAGGCDGSATNCTTTIMPLREVDSSWTPQYSQIVGYWKFNGSGSIANSTSIAAAIGPNATSVNVNGSGMSYASAYLSGLSQAIQFDGVDDYVLIPKQANNSFERNQAFSVQAWIYPTSSNYAMIVTDALQSAPYTGHNIQWGASWAGSQRIAVPVNDNLGNTIAVCTDSLGLNQWYHILVTYDGSNVAGGISIYINGELAPVYVINNSTLSGTSVNAFDWAVGSNSNSPTDFFAGRIDEVTIWNVALTASEAAQFYQNSAMIKTGVFTSATFNGGSSSAVWGTLGWIPTLPFGKPLPDFNGSLQNESTSDYTSLTNSTLMNGLVGLWHFDETAAGTAPGGTAYRDVSGQGVHGVVTGPVIYGTTGRFAQGARYQGYNATINTPSYTRFSSPNYSFGAGQDFSVSAWVKSTQQAVNGRWPKIASGETNMVPRNGWNFTLHNSNVDARWFGELWSAGAQHFCYGSSDVADGKWHHLVLQRSGANILMYQDGVLANTCAATAASIANSSNEMISGNQGGYLDVSGQLDGNVDELAVWTRALTATEVQQLYQRGVTRLSFQVRTCVRSDCSDNPSWRGPDGTSNQFFTEVHNNSNPSNGGNVAITDRVLPGLPSFSLSGFSSLGLTPRRYSQYRIFLESEDTGTSCNYGSGATACSPVLKSVSWTSP